MSVVPNSADLQQQTDGVLVPLAFGYLANIWLPSGDIEVEQTAYNAADTMRITTPLASASQDFGALTQQNTNPMPLRVRAGVPTDPQHYDARSFSLIIDGFLDYTNSKYQEDVIEFYGRGPLALLVDGRVTTRLPMNVDVGDAINKLITSNGLKAQTQKAGVTVGQLYKDDYVALGRNERVFDLIQFLANGVGWITRVVGQTVIVGPPPPRNSVPVINKRWSNGGALELEVQHSALHAHDIKVHVISYIPKSKTRVRSGQSPADTTDLLTGQGIQPPAPSSPSSAHLKAPTGRQVGVGSGNFQFSRMEEYIFHIPGLTKDQCDAKAQQIQNELSRHEFIATVRWSPTPQEIAQLSVAGPEFLINLSGASQSSHNQLYHPRKVTWTWNYQEGLKVEALCVNHDVPVNTGGE